jgi:DUF2975 family protein
MTSININRYARIFEILCMVFIPVVLVWSPIVWFFGDKLTDSTYGLHLANFTMGQRAICALIELGSNAMIVSGLIMLIRIARNFRNNQIFTEATVELFMRLRRGAYWWALYTIVYIIGFHSYFTITMPLSVILIRITSVGLNYLFVFVFLSILVTLIVKATQLQGDQDLTV